MNTIEVQVWPGEVKLGTGREGGLGPMLSQCVIGGEPGWLVIARTRHKHIRVGSVATSLSLTVLAITNHPGSGHADDIPNG